MAKDWGTSEAALDFWADRRAQFREQRVWADYQGTLKSPSLDQGVPYPQGWGTTVNFSPGAGPRWGGWMPSPLRGEPPVPLSSPCGTLRDGLPPVISNSSAGHCSPAQESSGQGRIPLLPAFQPTPLSPRAESWSSVFSSQDLAAQHRQGDL